MSNLETAPAEVACSASRDSGIEVLSPREVPLGGPQAIRVQRTLPQRKRSLIGAWCFIDHYGPVTARMDVPPHPHTGLQTVSWLFSGEVEHRDSAGVHALVRPGELNLMTAGRGFAIPRYRSSRAPSCTECSWGSHCPTPIATPAEASRTMCPTRSRLGAVARVFLGELAGTRSPVHTFTALLGAQIDLDRKAELHIDVNPAFEHGVLCDSGTVALSGTPLAVADLGYQGPGRAALHLRNVGDGRARIMLLGGARSPKSC